MRFLLVAGMALVMGGCASIPPPSPAAIDLPLVASWTLQGRIGILAGEQSLSGQIHWQHRAEADEVLMTAPLGQGVARIVRDADGVTLEVPNQPVRQAPDAELLTREALGYGLPVAGLVWWVQARPDPGRPHEFTRDSTGRVAQIRQDGWVIDYLQYTAADPVRPRKLTLAREGLEIRLVADSWLVE